MENFGDFIKGIDSRIPLRGELKNHDLTDIIHAPYGKCEVCEDGSEVNVTVRLYDLVQLANIMGDTELPEHTVELDRHIIHGLEGVKPYLEISACDEHIRSVINECIQGRFEYHETGKDPLHVSVADQTFMTAVDSTGTCEITFTGPTYPAHPLLEKRAEFLAKYFIMVNIVEITG